MNDSNRMLNLLGLLLALLAVAPMAAAQADRAQQRSGDYIAAVVNQELVTAAEVDQRMARLRDEAARNDTRLPGADDLRRQVLEALIEERVITTYARDSGLRVDESEIDRAVQSVAAQNQLSLPELRQRLQREGLDLGRFRANLRDQILFERVREREVNQRIRVSDAEIDQFMLQQRQAARGQVELNIAQILISVPEDATPALLAQRQARAEQARARVQAGEPFDRVALEMSDDSNRERGGEIGLRPSARLPDVFVEAVHALQPGATTPELLRTGAGFHLLKLLERRTDSDAETTQTHVRHILLRPSPQLSIEVARRRLDDFRRQIESGARRFEDLAREHSEDGSAAQGGDLGWASPGAFVSEFEEVMNALPAGGLSAPLVSRFGVHLIQVTERRQVALDVKQQREQARNALREQKFEAAYAEWVKDLRARAYVDVREPPL